MMIREIQFVTFGLLEFASLASLSTSLLVVDVGFVVWQIQILTTQRRGKFEFTDQN